MLRTCTDIDDTVIASAGISITSTNVPNTGTTYAGILGASIPYVGIFSTSTSSNGTSFNDIPSTSIPGASILDVDIPSIGTPDIDIPGTSILGANILVKAMIIVVQIKDHLTVKQFG